MAGSNKGKGQGRDLKRTNIYLKPSQIEWLKEYSKAKGVTRAEIVRKAIDMYEQLPEDVRDPDPEIIRQKTEEAEQVMSRPDFFDGDALDYISKRLDHLEELVEEKL